MVVSVTAMPGVWTSGTRLPIERRLHAASTDEQGWWWVAGDAGTILRVTIDRAGNNWNW